MTAFAEHLQNALGANYQLDRELPGGGMSRVFVAVDRSLGRNVVVKVLPPDLAAGVNRERFRREIQVAAQLQHPHIVPLLAAGEDGDLLWYTMPFIEGESLRTALERGRKFTVRDVMRILHDVVDALAFAHARGVIHRDIKPANILTQGTHALVADFGVAKALSAALPIGGITTTGIAIGTPAYMAPEQLAGDGAADQRMDIYAVGLLAYELITGVSPFLGASPRETMAAQLTHDPKPLHEVSSGVPRSFSDLIMRCLAKDPADRPQNADDILRELDSMTVPLGVTPTQTIANSRPLIRGWRLAASVVVPIAVVIAGAFIVQRQARHADTSPTIPTTTVSAPTPPVVAPTVSPAALPMISREDSIQIAAAIRRQMGALRTRDSAAMARLAEQMRKQIMDSIIAANSGASAATRPSPRRLLIIEPGDQPGWPESRVLGQAVSDSLRRMLRTRERQFTVVDQDSIRSVLLKSRDPNELTRSLNSDLVIVIRLRVLPRDSAILIVQTVDYGAIPPFRTRSANTRPAPKSEALAGLDQVLLSTVTYLDEMVRAPRRREQMPIP